MAQDANILVVDDEEVMRDFLQDVLESFDVELACDGEQAISLLEEKSYNLIITDMKMPGKSGEDVVRFAKGKYPDSKIIIISGYSTLSSVSNALKFGVDAFIAKPFTIKQIRTEVAKSLSAESGSNQIGA
ncbi:MAG: response regulator [candidate division Zixibacteria bacterium]|nr:response regulator [candidate division Zixibacteria bacterium]